MSGTIPLSMTQQMDQYGDPLDGGLLYFFVAGTVSTFQNAFKDITLLLPHPNPITLDATGRVPQLFLADGYIKIRLTDAAGVVFLVADNVQVIGASSGTPSGATIDATTIFSTGDLKHRHDSGDHLGWVRCNGRTIGPATSSASERANADTQQLFYLLWNANYAVLPSKGATNAEDDWATGTKHVTLPDLRGRTLAGLDDMGNTAASRLTASYFGADATIMGAGGGLERHQLTEAQLAQHLHTATSTPSFTGHVTSGTFNFGVVNGTVLVPAAGVTMAKPVDGGVNTLSVISDTNTVTTTLGNTGGNASHNNVQPTVVCTIYIKL